MANSKIPCSVEILTLNSAKSLPQTLESVRDFDEAYIVDGNSTDDTREVAHKYGATIHSQDENGGPNLRISDFAGMRAKADSLARNDWVFYLDSDEFASPELVEDIRDNLAKVGAEGDIKVVFSMPYSIIVEGKLVKYSFSYPRYIRVYNRRSGVSWKKSKTVHEKMDLPADVRVVPLKNFFYGHVPSHRECIAKDKHYLSIFRQKVLNKEAPPAHVVLRSIALNAARAVRISLWTLVVYVRHGFRESIPPSQAWRYVRYHVIVTCIRIEQLAKSL